MDRRQFIIRTGAVAAAGVSLTARRPAAAAEQAVAAAEQAVAATRPRRSDQVQITTADVSRWFRDGFETAWADSGLAHLVAVAASLDSAPRTSTARYSSLSEAEQQWHSEVADAERGVRGLGAEFAETVVGECLLGLSGDALCGHQGSRWGDPAGKPWADLVRVQALHRDLEGAGQQRVDFGVHAGLFMSRPTFNALAFNRNQDDLWGGAGARLGGRLNVAGVNALLRRDGLPHLTVFDAGRRVRGVFTPWLADGRVLFLGGHCPAPAAAGGGTVGGGWPVVARLTLGGAPAVTVEVEDGWVMVHGLPCQGYWLEVFHPWRAAVLHTDGSRPTPYCINVSGGHAWTPATMAAPTPTPTVSPEWR